MPEPLSAGSQMCSVVVHLLQPLSVLQDATLPAPRFAQHSQHGDSRTQHPTAGMWGGDADAQPSAPDLP